MRKMLFALSLFFSVSGFAQSKDADAVKAVMGQFKSTIERLDTAGVAALFVPGAKVFEGGKDEGGIKGYLDHHLAPELKAFKGFDYDNYKIDVQVMGDHAYSTETYTYTITLAKDDSKIYSRGVNTALLKRTPQGWKIASMHGSYRKINK